MNEKLTELKAQCGEMLRSSDVKATTKMGKSMVHAFWVGVLRSNPDMPHAYVSICLMSGRYEDLVT
mgnify:FL=1|jgi:hypothetical protein